MINENHLKLARWYAKTQLNDREFVAVEMIVKQLFEWEGMQSLDVYIDVNGRMGFLEQSNQFAIERLVCKPSIKTHMMNMVKRLVTRQD